MRADSHLFLSQRRTECSAQRDVRVWERNEELRRRLFTVRWGSSMQTRRSLGETAVVVKSTRENRPFTELFLPFPLHLFVPRYYTSSQNIPLLLGRYSVPCVYKARPLNRVQQSLDKIGNHLVSSTLSSLLVWPSPPPPTDTVSRISKNPIRARHHLSPLDFPRRHLDQLGATSHRGLLLSHPPQSFFQPCNEVLVLFRSRSTFFRFLRGEREGLNRLSEGPEGVVRGGGFL
jgi:hypothetical protein